MRIALLTNHFPPLLDGVGDYSFHLANELQRVGHTVSVICKQHSSIKQAVENGQFDIPISATIPVWNWQAIQPLHLFLKEQRPDWLLVQYVPNGFHRWSIPIWLPILMWIIKQRSVRIGITFHEVSIRRKIWPVKYALVSVSQRLVAWTLAQLADEVATSIDFYLDQLQRYTHKVIHLIPIGSNIVPTLLTKDEVAMTRQTIAPNGGPIISTFGIRNQDLLLQVIDRLVQQLPTLNLLIIGQLRISQLAQPLYLKLQSQIHVSGYLLEADVYRYLSTSDIFFIPDMVTVNGEGGSSNKSTSLAAGLAAGLPVVGTLGDMNNSLLQQTPGVFLENGNDPNEIAQRLLLLLTDGSVQNQRQTILRFFDQILSWKAIARQYTKAFGWPQPIQDDNTSTR